MSAGSAARAAGKAVIWLAGRSVKISKHVGLHSKAAAKHLSRPWVMAKTVHSVFRGRNPKKLVEKALVDFDKFTMQRGGRILLQKEFEGPIGRDGERILSVVVEEATGKIITAFPAREFAAGASGLVALLFFEHSAEASERVNAVVSAAAKWKNPTAPWAQFMEFGLTIFLFDESDLYEDEDLLQKVEAIKADQFNKFIKEYQEQNQFSLVPEKYNDLRTKFYDAITCGVAVDTPDGD